MRRSVALNLNKKVSTIKRNADKIFSSYFSGFLAVHWRSSASVCVCISTTHVLRAYFSSINLFIYIGWFHSLKMKTCLFQEYATRSKSDNAPTRLRTVRTVGFFANDLFFKYLIIRSIFRIQKNDVMTYLRICSFVEWGKRINSYSFLCTDLYCSIDCCRCCCCCCWWSPDLMAHVLFKFTDANLTTKRRCTRNYNNKINIVVFFFHGNEWKKRRNKINKKCIHKIQLYDEFDLNFQFANCKWQKKK